MNNAIGNCFPNHAITQVDFFGLHVYDTLFITRKLVNCISLDIIKHAFNNAKQTRLEHIHGLMQHLSQQNVSGSVCNPFVEYLSSANNNFIIQYKFIIFEN